MLRDMAASCPEADRTFSDEEEIGVIEIDERESVLHLGVNYKTE